MAKKKKQPKRVSNSFVVISSPEGNKDEKGQKAMTEARSRLEADGYRLVKSAVIEDEFGHSHSVMSGKLPSGRNFLLIGEKPL